MMMEVAKGVVEDTEHTTEAGAECPGGEMVEGHEDMFCHGEEEDVWVGDSVPAVEAEEAADVYAVAAEYEAGDDE